MAEAATKLPIRTDKDSERAPAQRPWGPMEILRRDFNRLYEEFSDLWPSTIRQALLAPEARWSRELGWAASPAVDIAEKDKAYEVTAELPGIDEKNVEVKVANGMLTIKGEKKEEKEERKKDYYLSERRYGAFERRFPIPDGVEADKIEATFKKGLLTVTLPKTAAAQAAEKKSWRTVHAHERLKPVNDGLFAVLRYDGNWIGNAHGETEKKAPDPSESVP